MNIKFIHGIQFYLENTLFLFYSPRFHIISNHRIPPFATHDSHPFLHPLREIFSPCTKQFLREFRPCSEIQKYSRVLYIAIVKRPRKRYPTSSNVPNDFSIRVRSFRTGISMRDRTKRKKRNTFVVPRFQRVHDDTMIRLDLIANLIANQDPFVLDFFRILIFVYCFLNKNFNKILTMYRDIEH